MPQQYNAILEDSIDHYFAAREHITKKKEMGGVGWLINGNMCVGIYEDLLVVRVAPALVDSLIKKDGIHLFGHRKQHPDNFLSVTRAIYDHSKALHKFLSHAVEFTSTLPPNDQYNPSAKIQ